MPLLHKPAEIKEPLKPTPFLHMLNVISGSGKSKKSHKNVLNYVNNDKLKEVLKQYKQKPKTSRHGSHSRRKHVSTAKGSKIIGKLILSFSQFFLSRLVISYVNVCY